MPSKNFPNRGVGIPGGGLHSFELLWAEVLLPRDGCNGAPSDDGRVGGVGDDGARVVAGRERQVLEDRRVHRVGERDDERRALDAQRQPLHGQQHPAGPGNRTVIARVQQAH